MTEEQKQQKAILELGRELIKNLDSHDITAKWMSTYLAELMVAAETNPAREAECKELIIELWRERRSLIGGDLMERYSQTLAAVEALLKTGRPLIEVWMPQNNSEPRKNDWASLSRTLQCHSDLLAGTAATEAIKTDGLIDDDLVSIAHLADPDDQTHLLNILYKVVQETNEKTGNDEENDHVIKTIADLRSVIDDFEVMYRESSHRNKPII